jgi:hypothetical protein
MSADKKGKKREINAAIRIFGYGIQQNRLEKSHMDAGRSIGNRSVSVLQASSGNRLSFRGSCCNNTHHNIHKAPNKNISQVRLQLNPIHNFCSLFFRYG